MVSEILPNLNWIAHPETANIPLISFGTSSDRIFTPEGNQAYYVTFAKGIPNSPVAPYISIAYSDFEKGFTIPFGCNIGLGPTVDLLYMNDGKKSHALLTFKTISTNYTLMLIDLEKPRVGISIGFGF